MSTSHGVAGAWDVGVAPGQAGVPRCQSTSDAKLVLPYDLSMPEVWVVPKGNKYSHKGGLTDACSGALALPETDPVTRDSSFPSMWHDWLLDFEQIMNHRQMPVIISDQDEDLLSSTMALKGREGA